MVCCSVIYNHEAHVLTSLSCFLNMETINEMVENEDPYRRYLKIMDRISKGKNPYIGSPAWVISPSSPIRRCSETECYLE